MQVYWLGGLALTLSFAVGLALIRVARRLRLVQVPNQRSSHQRTTPTGGGIAILSGSLVAGPFLAGDLLLLSGAGLAMAALGLWDDLHEPPVWLRLLLQIAAAAALVVVAGPERIAALLGPYAPFIVGLFAVWWINLFNFMDGIDGLAAAQAVFMLAGGVLITFLTHQAWAAEPETLAMVAIGGATLGFLALNLPPARLFMGDIGSYFLATMIFALALTTVMQGWVSLQSWLILGAAFVSDATVTLATRILRREEFWRAHRSHAYQRIARVWGGHGRVTAAFAAINVLFLLPLAVLAEAAPIFAWGITAFAYGPLLVAAQQFGAGKPDNA
jgi:Fuc2NAc and GlcNAc transferase